MASNRGRLCDECLSPQGAAKGPALIGAVAAAALACLTGTAGDARAQSLKPQKVDITPVRDQLTVLRSDTGHYIVIQAFDTGGTHFYFGDKKNLYRQRSYSGRSNGTKSFALSYWSPRNRRSGGEIELRDGQWNVVCDDRKTPFSELTGAEASALLDKGRFFTPLWTRTAHFLARDDDGNYYYVDKDRPRESAGHRLFVGPKGALRSYKLTNVVEDSQGALYVSKQGRLKTIAVRGGPAKSQWITGKGRRKVTEDLTTVPVVANVMLVYAQLGVYEGKLLGTPCDFY